MIKSAIAIVALTPLVKAAAPYCLPSQPCFPHQNTLISFNASVGGRLLEPAPYGAVCYAGTYDASACANLIQNKGQASFRKTLPGTSCVKYPQSS